MKKFLAGFLTLLLAALFVLGGTGCSAKARATRHLKQADHFYDANDFNQAEIEYINVLRNDPRNTAAISRLGKIYFDEGRLERAARFLLAATQMATNDLDVHLKLGFVYAAAGKLKEARDEANFILDQKPQDAEAPLLLAEASLAEKEIAEATLRLQTLSGKSDSASLEVALGTLAFHARDLKTAGETFQRAQHLDPKSAAVYSALGTFYEAENSLKPAETAFKTAAELSPVRSSRRIQYANFEARNGGMAVAKNVLDEIVAKAPDYLPAWLGLGEIALLQKKFDDCTAALNRAFALEPKNFNASLLNGQLDLTRGQTVKAVAELEKLAKDYPQVARIHYQLGRAYLQNGDLTKGVNSLNKALSMDPTLDEAALVLAEVQTKTGDIDSSITSLEKLIQRQPQMLQARLLLADDYRAKGYFDDALGIYRQLEKLFPQNSQIPLFAGSTFVQKKDNEQARAEFHRALEISTNNLPALQQLISLDLMEKKYADALQLIQDEIAKKPAQAELWLLEAGVFLAQGDDAHAEADLKKVIAMRPEADTAYLLMGELYAELKQNDKALANLQLAVEKNPTSIAALMALGVFQNGATNYNAAAETYEKILAINPKFGPALNNLAYLYSEQLNQIERANDLAQKARNLYPGNPSVADTLGWILYKKGQYQSASSLLRESAGQLPREPEIQFHLGMADYMSGREDAARGSLQHALDLNKDFSGREECKSSLSILAIDPKTAGADERMILEKRIAACPDDPIALVRLTTIYQRSGESDKSIGLYETALKSNPKNIKATMALVQLYAPKDLQRAFDLAMSAYKSSPDEPGLSHLLGRLADMTGNYKLAFGLLQNATQNPSDDPASLYYFALAAYSLGKVPDAISAMQNVLPVAISPEQSNQASLFLELTSLAANPAQAIASRAEINGILKTNASYVPALMAMAVINEQSGDIAGAQMLYEKILGQYPDFSPAQRALAILYANDSSKTGRAYELAVKSRDDFPNDPLLTKATGIILFQQGDYLRAINSLKTAIAIGKPDAEEFYYLGAAQYRLKNVEAKTSLQQALTLNLSGNQADEARRILAELK